MTDDANAGARGSSVGGRAVAGGVGGSQPAHSMHSADAEGMRSAGIDPPPDLKIDGQLHRFSTKGRARDDSGWYIIFPDEPSAGRFGCWRDGIDVPMRRQFEIERLTKGELKADFDK